MKYFSFVLIFAIGFSSCKTSGIAFHHPENFHNIKATVHLIDNTTLSGYLSYKKHQHPGSTRLNVPGERKNLDLNVSDIRSYTTEFGVFEYKILHKAVTSPFEKGTVKAFVKRLSPADAPFHVYEYIEKSATPKSAMPRSVKHYFVSLPGAGQDQIWDIEGDKFRPDFNNKLKELVKDKSWLVEKIDAKDHRFYYKSFTLRKQEKHDVLLNLINHYNMCEG